MRTTVNRRIFRANIFSRNLVNLSVAPHALVLTSEGDTATVSVSVPAISQGTGTAYVSMQGDALKSLASAHDTEQLKIELFANYICCDTEHSFVSLNGAVGRTVLLDEPDSDNDMSPCDLHELFSQLSAMAKLNKCDLAVSLNNSALTADAGGQAQATIDCDCSLGSGCWRLTTRDADTLTMLLKRQSLANGGVQLLVNEQGLSFVCERWQVTLHEPSNLMPKAIDHDTKEGARISIADLRRSLSQILCLDAEEVRFASRGRILSVSTDCADLSTGKVVTKCSGALFATWNPRLLAKFLDGATGTVVLSQSQSRTRFAVLANSLNNTSQPNFNTRKLVHG